MQSMLIKERLAELGRTFFRLRSFLPLLLVPVTILLGRSAQLRPSSEGAGALFDLVCFGISACGLAIRCAATGYAAPGTSGRQREWFWAGSLNTCGLYSLVRNPLYVGNFLCWMGVMLVSGSLVVAGITLAFFAAIYIPVILAEEEYLSKRFGESYLAWARKTPALIPKLALWRPLRSEFNWKRTVKKEPDSVMAMVTCFCAVAVYRDSLLARTITIEPAWIGLWIGVSVLWLALKATKKYTRFLAEPKWKAPGTGMPLASARSEHEIGLEGPAPVNVMEAAASPGHATTEASPLV